MFALLTLVACLPSADPPRGGPSREPTPAGPADSAGSDTAGESGDDTSGGAAPASVTPRPRAGVDPIVCAAAGAPAEATFQWTVDGAPFAGLVLATERPGDTVFPGYTHADERWTCTVSGPDGVLAVGSTTPIAVDLLELDPLLAAPASAVGGVVRYTGPLASGFGVTLWYGFDGWSERGAPTGASAWVSQWGDVLYGQELHLTHQGDAWVGTIDVPPGARAVQMVFAGPGGVDDAQGLEYTWDFVFPSVGPYLTWNEATHPESGVVVSWATGRPGRGIVEYGPDEEHVALAVGAEVGTLHHVALEGLPSDTAFVYRVRDAAGRTSPWSRFRTAPPDASSFQFLVMSDMQDGGGPAERWSEIAAQMAADHPDARFVVAPGDLTANDLPGLWWTFFDSGRGLFDHVPIVPATGNHDTPCKESSPDTSSFERWFGLDPAAGLETWRQQDYGRLRILSLDSESVEELQEGGAQYEWLRVETEALGEGKAPDVDWAIVQLHHPPFDAGGRFADEAHQFRAFTDLLGGRVNLVLAGHEHIYQRFLPIGRDGEPAASGEYGTGPEDGVCYLVTASAWNLRTTAMVAADAPGGEQRAALAYPTLADDEDSVRMDHGYLAVDVSPEHLLVHSIGMGTTAAPEAPTVRDEVEIGP